MKRLLLSLDGGVALAWDEDKHPRDPGGEDGGQFVEKGYTEAESKKIDKIAESEAEAMFFWHHNDYNVIQESEKDGSDYGKQFNKGLNRFPKFKGDVYRGLRDVSPDKFKAGSTITLDQSESASKSRAKAMEFARNGVLLHVKTKSGVDLSRALFKLDDSNDDVLEEQEVVLRHKSKYRVSRVEGTNVYLEEV